VAGAQAVHMEEIRLAVVAFASRLAAALPEQWPN
jgi:hypothetical protein